MIQKMCKINTFCSNKYVNISSVMQKREKKTAKSQDVTFEIFNLKGDDLKNKDLLHNCDLFIVYYFNKCFDIHCV